MRTHENFRREWLVVIDDSTTAEMEAMSLRGTNNAMGGFLRFPRVAPVYLRCRYQSTGMRYWGRCDDLLTPPSPFLDLANPLIHRTGLCCTCALNATCAGPVGKNQSLFVGNLRRGTTNRIRAQTSKRHRDIRNIHQICLSRHRSLQQIQQRLKVWLFWGW